MLFGKKFKIEDKNKVFSSVKTNESILECSTFNKDIFSLKGRPDSYNDPIMFQIQLRGSGKTKSLYDLGMKRDIIYIDFTCKDSSSTNFTPFSSCLSKIKDLTIKSLKHDIFKEEKELTDRVQEIIKALIFSCIIYHDIFREVYKNESSEFFLRHFLNGGQRILNYLFNNMLDYEIYDIEQIISLNFKLDLMFAYDEVGCLVDCFKGNFLKKTITEEEFDSNDNKQFRGLFDIFSIVCLKIKELKYYQSKNLIYYKY
jgi:hypothetical protein